MNDPADGEKERIARRIARAGLCSRREAERRIAQGRVALNGTVLVSPAVTVGPRDRILVDGAPLPDAAPSRIWRYYKPRGLVTTHRDERGRTTIFDTLPDTLPRVISVGRLDLNSEGLLLLSNDGGLSRRLELPATGWARRYRVRLNGNPRTEQLERLKDGLTVDGMRYGPIEATLDVQKGDNAWLTVSLREGKNREIRHVMAHFGWTVSRLIRISYGPFQLGTLNPGETDEISPRVLREQLGIESAPGAARRGRPRGGPPRRPKGDRAGAPGSRHRRPGGPAADRNASDPPPTVRPGRGVRPGRKKPTGAKR